MFTKEVVMTTGGIRSFAPTSDSSHPIKWLNKKKRESVYQQTIGEDIELVTLDHAVRTDPHENRKRRTLVICKSSKQNWGFTVQSYGIQHSETQSVDNLTYVDYVEVNGPAYLAGMMAGDVILSINGTSLESASHAELVGFIRGCEDEMRVVVLFEDCCRKVELHLKLRKLKKLLAAKMFELNSLEKKERNLLEGRKDSLSLHSTSLLSLFDDSFFLPPEEDVFSDSQDSMPAASYGSLPSLKQAKQDFETSTLRKPLSGSSNMIQSHVTNSPVTSSNSPGSSTGSSVDLNESRTSVISLNPRVDHRYTSLPPDMRRRSIYKSDRKIGNSLFYGEWLSENEEREEEPSSLSRDSGFYQTWSGGGSRNKVRSSTRSVGNSLFYVDSDVETSDESDTESQKSGGSQAHLDHQRGVDEVASSGGKNSRYSEDSGKRLKNGSGVSKVTAKDTHSPPANRNDVVKMRNKQQSPTRPVSLPNLQSLTLEVQERDSGIESPPVLDPNGLPDSVSSVSDWISSDSCDIRPNITSDGERHLVNTKSSKIGIARARKNVVSTGSVPFSGASKTSKYWKGTELSRSMGNLSNPEPQTKKSPTSPLLFKSFANWGPVKFTRSKIRHSLSRLRNKSSSYNVSKKKSEVSQDLESPDQFSADDNAFSDIQAYATLPKRPKILKPNAKAKRPVSVIEQSYSASDKQTLLSDPSRTCDNAYSNISQVQPGLTEQTSLSDTSSRSENPVTLSNNSTNSGKAEDNKLSSVVTSSKKSSHAPEASSNEESDSNQSSVGDLYEEVMSALQTRSDHSGEHYDRMACDNLENSVDNNNDYPVFEDVCKAFDEVELYSSTETLTEQSGVCGGDSELDCTLVRATGTKYTSSEDINRNESAGVLEHMSFSDKSQGKTNTVNLPKHHSLSNASGKSKFNKNKSGNLSATATVSKTSSEHVEYTPSSDFDVLKTKNVSTGDPVYISDDKSVTDFDSSTVTSVQDLSSTRSASTKSNPAVQHAFKSPLSHITGAYHNPSTLSQASTQSNNTETKSRLNASKVEFFSRNMTPVQTRETGSQSVTSSDVELEKKPSTETVQPLTSSQKSASPSPKRFVIHVGKWTKGGASDVGTTRWSEGYKRRFYTYKEIPAMKSEYSLVNPESCETWL